MSRTSRPTWRRRWEQPGQVGESIGELTRKWDRRHESADGPGQVPMVLEQNLHLLPPAGDALDIACGRGAGAVRLAMAGMRVSAWDLSGVAIERLRRAACEKGLQIAAEVRDVVARPPHPASFDLILVSYFLERTLAKSIIQALRPGGLLFYQTFSREAVSESGPANPAYRLADNELLQLFSPLRVRFYREEGRLGDTGRGIRDIAMLIAEKRP